MPQNNKNSKKINYNYFLNYVKSIPEFKNIKVLDFGCGNGEIVELLRENQINCFGVEVKYEGANFDIDKSLLEKGIIKIMSADGPIPFPEQEFDIIISNQVFEHIPDIELVLKKILRVLKDNGRLYCHFPTLNAIKEGHCSIPMSHWFKPDSKFRFSYTYLMRFMGFGCHKNSYNTKYNWVRHKLNWLDSFCYYRKYKEIRRIFLKYFHIKHREIDYIYFRGSNKKVISWLLKLKVFHNIYSYIFRKSAFIAIELKKNTINKNKN